MLESPGEAFRDLAARLVSDPVDGADLVEAALAMSALFVGPQDASAIRAVLDDLSEAARPGVLRGVEEAGERGAADALVATLCEAKGFRGNRDGYYDPRNSFLADVLERRTGIPISLALVYVEVSNRLDLPIYGVGFPGHFLTRFWNADSSVDTLWIDAFSGQVLDHADCAERWKASVPGVPFSPAGLGTATVRDFLVRMLNNLKQIYLKERDAAFSLACCDGLVELHPGNAHERRDRGLLYEQLGRPSLARADLEAFLAAHPEDESAGAVRARLTALSGKHEQLN